MIDPVDPLHDSVEPLHEDDLADPGVLDPALHARRARLPEAAVLCFFPEVVAAFVEAGARRLARLSSERESVVWEIEVDGRPLAIVHPGIGAPLAAMTLEELIAMGVTQVVAVGGAGVLVPDLVMGHAVVVGSALRDEGTSAHYLRPGRVVDADPQGAEVLRRTLDAAGLPHVTGRTWTTDAVYRETRARVARRREEGCVTVDMEASAFIAVARFRGIRLAQLLLAADSLAGPEWDARGWTTARAARSGLTSVAARAALAL
ncbi:phosphorylase [Pseudonocardia sulfidoxydans NBRC 16205]|uniref:Uridine phosphorylase n=2 Tax=Pseudonocardia sulfidoxydans TaxID=54011 RepID=A0A511DFM0_9PSEU|nr:phosphorylase [Pseudonocardia sulfidoxydans NBRC 16205]